MNASTASIRSVDEIEAHPGGSYVSASSWFAPWALLCLAFPGVVFFLTWFKPVIGWPAAIVVCAAIVQVFRNKEVCAYAVPFRRRDVFFLAALALLWAVLSGAGAFVPQSSDYVKHNLLLHDLETKPWPVFYHTGHGARFLCYGLSYYLPSALVGAACGDLAGRIAAVLWSAICCFLILYWVGSMNRRRPWLTIGVFLLVAGMQFLWFLARHSLPPLVAHFCDPQRFSDSFESLGLFAGYAPALFKSYWAPQHGIPGWLGVALLYELLWVRGKVGCGFLVGALVLGWSPLTCTGLLVVPLAWLFSRPSRWSWQLVSLAAGLVVFVLYAIYYSAHDPLADKGPIWTFKSELHWTLFYAVFAVTQVLLLAICVWLMDRRWKLLDGWRPLYYVSVALLLALPLYKFGLFGDLRMQGANGPGVIVALAISFCLTSGRVSWRHPLYICLAVLTALTAGTTLLRTAQDVSGRSNKSVTWRLEGSDHQVALPDFSAATIERQGVADLSEINKIGLPFRNDFSFDLAGQYLGNGENSGCQRLLKPPPAGAPVEPSPGESR